MIARTLFLLLAVVSVTKAQRVIDLGSTWDARTFMPYELMVYVDTTNTVSFDQIASPGFQARFRQNSSYLNKDYIPSATYWVTVNIRPDHGAGRAWVLEFLDQTIDSLIAYIPARNTYEKIVMGDQLPFASREWHHKNFEIPIDTESGKELRYYFKIRSHEFADIRMAVKSMNYFVYYATNEYFLFGTFYGMILIISLYNFLVYLAIREIKNIFYICYLLSVAAYALALDGIGFQYMWPNHPEWNLYATGVALYSLIMWALIFTQRFLSTDSVAPRLHRALQVVMILRTTWFCIALFFLPQWLPFRNADIIPLSLIFYTSWHVWSKGYRPARFFVVGYGILFVGFFIRTLVYFNVLPFTILSHYSLHFSFVLEMLFLTVALGDRIRILKDNRDAALRGVIQQHEVNLVLQDKVNRELEQKVKERTEELDAKNHELQESNARLALQAKEINQINSLLDLDNWKLKNRVKEVLEERLHEKAMDYGEFTTLYPDSLACHRFLESIKWEKGYRCRKCSNEKWSPGTQKFSRRCSRCGYNESITAYTVFHSLKFPIEKAFYLTYLTASGNKDETLEQLSDRLDIRLNTVWAFKTKIQSRLKELQQGGHQPRQWEDLILLDGEKSSRQRPSRPPRPSTQPI